MVVLIRRMLMPLIRKYFRLFLSMIVVSCLGIALMAGLGGAFYALEDGFSDYLDMYGYANVCITTSPSPKQLCEELGSLEGVLQADGRMAADFPLKAGGYQLTARVFSFSPDSEQRFYVREETEASGTLPELYVEADFAQANGIASGDELELKLANTYQKFQVQKIVSTPEAISTVQNAYFWGNNSDFGYVYLPEEYVQMVFGSDQFVCQFLLKVDAEHDETTVLEDAKQILQQYQILDCFASEDSPVRQRIETNLEPLQALSLLLPPLFFAVMLLVMLLFLLQIIQQSRKEIGILRTFGFSSGQISGLFHALCFCVTIPAIGLGIGCSQILMQFAANLYAQSFWLPPITAHLQLRDCLIAAGCTALTGQLAAAIGCRQLSKIRPVEVLQGTRSSSVSTAQLNRLPKRLSPLLKFSAAVMLRNGRRFILSSVCIAASMMLIVSAISFDRSKNYILEELFEKRISYDCQIYLEEAPDEIWMQKIGAVPGVSECERLDYLSTDLKFNGMTEEIVIHAPETDTRLIRVFDKSDALMDIPEDGILLEGHLAKKLGITVGDNVYVNGRRLTVQGLSNQSVSRVQYVSQQTIGRLGAGGCSVLVASNNEDALRSYLEDMDGCQAVFTRVVRQDRIRSFQSYSIGVYIIIAFALAMSLMIVQNRMKSSLMEQQHRLATMRVLGVHNKEISVSWLLQSILQYVIAAIAGLPAGAVAAQVILHEMSTSKREYPFANRAEEYLFASGILLLFILLGHFLSMRQLKRWNLAEAGRTME